MQHVGVTFGGGRGKEGGVTGGGTIGTKEASRALLCTYLSRLPLPVIPLNPLRLARYNGDFG